MDLERGRARKTAMHSNAHNEDDYDDDDNDDHDDDDSRVCTHRLSDAASW